MDSENTQQPASAESFSEDGDVVTLKMSRKMFDQINLVLLVGMGEIAGTDASYFASVARRAYKQADRVKIRDVFPDAEMLKAVDHSLDRVPRV